MECDRRSSQTSSRATSAALAPGASVRAPVISAREPRKFSWSARASKRLMSLGRAASLSPTRSGNYNNEGGGVSDRSTRCVLLADKPHGLIEGVRGLHETAFGTVFMVGDEASLLGGVERLEPSVIVVDLAFAGGNWLQVLRTVRGRSALSKVMYDELSVVRAALGAGANGFVLKRTLATDMLDAIEAVLDDKSYISPCVHAPAEVKPQGQA